MLETLSLTACRLFFIIVHWCIVGSKGFLSTSVHTLRTQQPFPISPHLCPNNSQHVLSKYHTRIHQRRSLDVDEPKSLDQQHALDSVDRDEECVGQVTNDYNTWQKVTPKKRRRIKENRMLQEERTKSVKSRRDLILQSSAAAVIVMGSVFATTFIQPGKAVATSTINSAPPSNSTQKSIISTASEEMIEPIDFTKVMAENKINITIANPQSNSQTYINPSSYEKIKKTSYAPSWLQIPSFIPNTLKQSMQQVLQKEETIEIISDNKVFVASIIAGSFTETIRSLVLYPITTIKTRIQYCPPSTSAFVMSYQKLVGYMLSTFKLPRDQVLKEQQQ